MKVTVNVQDKDLPVTIKISKANIKYVKSHRVRKHTTDGLRNEIHTQGDSAKNGWMMGNSTQGNSARDNLAHRNNIGVDII